MFKPTDHLTAEHIRRWAYKKNKAGSNPVWNDTLIDFSHANVLLDIAHDPDCPRRAAILNCLYMLTGTIVSKHEVSDVAKLRELLDSVRTTDQVINNWANRSRVILQDLRKYDYAEWCEGGFADRDLPNI